MEYSFYSYISTKTDADCVQTIFVCAPEEDAKSIESAERFAKKSGWIHQAEENKAVLIIPLTSGYDQLSPSWPVDFYEKHKNDFRAPSGVTLPGRDGILWLWEPMIYCAGYNEGADYAAEAIIANPGFFAASALVNGSIKDYSSTEKEAGHWFVRNPSDYSKKNREIPSAVWMAGDIDPETLAYFVRTANADTEKIVRFEEIAVAVRYCKDEPAQEVWVTESSAIPSADMIMNQFFNHILRWKNSPDGILKHYSGRWDYMSSDKYHHDSVISDGEEYPYAIYVPEGKTADDVKDMPVVFSLHGRGEPGWVFAEKNGWHELADETGEFIVVIPDSRFNIWKIERDLHAVKTILEKVYKTYQVDLSRVYITGFSNGGIYTAQQASLFPEIFAAASPWNAPGMQFCAKTNTAPFVYHPGFIHKNIEIPFWICVGDRDTKASSFREDELEIVLAVNHCRYDSETIWDSSNHYTADKGYREGDRFHTRVFSNDAGSVRVGLTVMKNMPHGAIYDESRAAWEFMKRFRRADDQIVEIKETEDER